MAFKLGVKVDLCMAYILLLILITMTHGHSGSAEEKNQRWIISTTKQVTSIKLATMVGLFFGVTLTVTLKTFIWLDYLFNLVSVSTFLKFFLPRPSGLWWLGEIYELWCHNNILGTPVPSYQILYCAVMCSNVSKLVMHSTLHQFVSFLDP